MSESRSPAPPRDPEPPLIWPDDVPDPNAEPKPLISGSTLDKLSVGALTILSGGVGLFILSALLTPTCGSTRSSRLIRQQRQEEAERAVAQFNHQTPAELNSDSVVVNADEEHSQ